MRLQSLLMQFEIGISMRRYLPPIGTAGLERSMVRGYRRVPRPPPRMRLKTSRCIGRFPAGPGAIWYGLGHGSRAPAPGKKNLRDISKGHENAKMPDIDVGARPVRLRRIDGIQTQSGDVAGQRRRGQTEREDRRGWLVHSR